MRHHGDGIWEGVAPSAQVVRYHSLAVAEPLPEGVEATAWAEDGTVMSLQYESVGAPRWGVQFHPESIDSTCGLQLAINVLRLAHQWWGTRRAAVSASVPVVEGITAVQLAEVLRCALQEGESFRWLDDSLGETTSLWRFAASPGGLPAITQRARRTPTPAGFGVLPYEVDGADLPIPVWWHGGVALVGSWQGRTRSVLRRCGNVPPRVVSLHAVPMRNRRKSRAGGAPLKSPS
ncbi:MAG: gamma-glutamyl-gamma-aminobutyrate hydrolase family protein [Lawsonella clevelandensis]